MVEEIADVDHAARVVERLAVHGQARMAGGAKYLKHIGELGLKRRGDDVGAGNHHIADLHFMQGEGDARPSEGGGAASG